jgi:hypothetical protein
VRVASVDDVAARIWDVYRRTFIVEFNPV